MLSESAFARPMTNIYLSAEEFSALAHLPHRSIKKTRHHIMERKHRGALDVFKGDLAGLVMAEIECDSIVELMSISPPEWATIEVTKDVFFSGGNLSQISAKTLRERLQIR